MARKVRIVNGHYYVDPVGSRCRDAYSGKFADCNLCARCPIRPKKKK